MTEVIKTSEIRDCWEYKGMPIASLDKNLQDNTSNRKLFFLPL